MVIFFHNNHQSRLTAKLSRNVVLAIYHKEGNSVVKVADVIYLNLICRVLWCGKMYSQTNS